MNQEVTHLQVLAELERLALDKEFEKDIANKNPGKENFSAFTVGWKIQVAGKIFKKSSLKKFDLE